MRSIRLQSPQRDRHRKQHRRYAVLLVLMAAVACVALTACGGSNKDVPAFSADELTTLPQQDWITNGGTVFNQRYSPLDEINTLECRRPQGRLAHPSRFRDRVEVLRRGAAARPRWHRLCVDRRERCFRAGRRERQDDLEVRRQPVRRDHRPSAAAGRVAVSRSATVASTWASSTESSSRSTPTRAKRSGLPAVGDWRKGETITSAPLYYDGLVITGLSGGEFGVRGSVTAYDAETGKLVWRFYTIPGPGETGHETWPQDNDAWKHGGAPVWQTPAVDPKLGLLYFSTGNTSPGLRRQQPQGRQPVRELDRRPRRQDGRVPLALPAGAP